MELMSSVVDVDGAKDEFGEPKDIDNLSEKVEVGTVVEIFREEVGRVTVTTAVVCRSSVEVSSSPGLDVVLDVFGWNGPGIGSYEKPSGTGWSLDVLADAGTVELPRLNVYTVGAVPVVLPSESVSGTNP
jgi:hypothetical protein